MVRDIDKFVHDQLSVWPAVAAKYRDLKSARTRTLPFGGLLVTLQSNPGRLPIFDHGCPLCEENYLERQHTLPFEGRKGRKYNILVNRAPIFPNHLVITRDTHVPQSIWHRFPDMLDLAATLEGYLVFYNSPNSGTSVPQHAHFQACPRGYMPLERVADRLFRALRAGETPAPEELEQVDSVQEARLYHYKRFNRGIFLLKARTSKSMAKQFYRLLDCMNLVAEETEPRFNAFAWCGEGEYRAIVTLRSASRPQCYYAEGEAHFGISPGAADMAGFVVVPQVEDFDRLDAGVLQGIYDDVCLSEQAEERLLWRLVRTQPRVEVGVAAAPETDFEIISDGAGRQKVSYREGKIDYNGVLYDELVFEAVTVSTLFAEPSFLLYGTSGARRYAGTLKFLVDGGKVLVVNILGVEDYLLSVISALPEDQRSGQVIRIRGELLEQMRRRKAGKASGGGPALNSTPAVVTYLTHKETTETEPLAGASHARYDVCAGEHGWQYEGLTPAADAHVRALIDETWGKTE